MHHPATDIADRAQPPDPIPDRPVPSVAAAPTHVARLLVLIRWLIDYGSELAVTLHKRAVSPDFQGWAGRYRQSDIVIIAARIRRGLLLAAGLETKLTGLTAKGRDLTVTRLRPLSERKSPSGEPKKRRAPRRTHLIDLPVHTLPTAEQIAEELRRRPVGAVLVDICRDLGLDENDLPPELARVLRETIIFCGGSLVTLLFAENKPVMAERARAAQASYRNRRSKPPAGSAESPAHCTGPP
jgi:hypothetical protein